MSRFAKIVCFAVVAVVLHCGRGAGLIAAEAGQQQGGSVADKGGFEQTDVFLAGELAYKEFRIPALVVTKSGTLLAISEAGRTSADAGDRDILLRRSTDGGRTWSKQVQVILDKGTSRCGSPACLVDTKTGRVHLLAAVDCKKALHTYSDDDGTTWAEFVDVTGPFEALRTKWSWTRFDTGPARGIELTRGKHRGRFVQPIWLSKGEEQYRSGVIYSDDRGRTWKLGGLINEVEYNTNECSVYEAVDGTLWMNIRGGDALPTEGRKPFRLIATSKDGGLSWSRLRHDENLIGPRCLASTLRYSRPQEGRSRTLFANPANEKHRVNMTVRLSYDEGRSWPVAKQVFAGPSAYSCLARLPNGDIGLLYERGDKYRYEKMTFARFTLAWLTDGKDNLAAGLTTEKEFTNPIGMKMVPIERGVFLMGQEREAGGRSITLTYGDRHFMGGELDEQPVHTVIISQPFHMSATEVTNAQYEQFDPNHRSFRGRHGLSSEDDEAVVYVSWHQATAFCEWLSGKEKRPYRLPTEAEWEYACRAGTTTRFNTGDTLPEAYQKAQKHRSRPEKVSTRVGLTPPNPWGLHDMHGNVEEWCYDWYGSYVPGEQTDPVGRKNGLWKVVRGGSHNVYLKSLRSANRMSTLPEDKHWLIGFRVVQAEMPATEPLPPQEPPLNACNVSQKPYDWSKGPDMTKPYFEGPVPYVRKPKKPESVPFFFHNHVPSITWCDNGDLLAAWFSCARERGRELGIVASRFRRDTGQWDTASAFFNARDRNEHGTVLYNDGSGKIYHLNGLGTDGWWSKLALTQRLSTDNGAAWSYPRLVDPEHGRYIPHMGMSKTSEGYLVFPADAPGGTGLYMSCDAGQTWQMVTNNTSGGNIRGTHAAVVQLADGSLMGFGRGKPIDGRMPMSLSKDMGKSWTYSATEFPPVSGGQRTVLLRLREGPILHVSFTDTADYERVILDKPRPRRLSEIGIAVKDAAGKERRVYGMFAAVTFDEGRTWPVKKLVTAGGPPRKLNGNAWTQDFVMDQTHAEPLGYLAITQSPDDVIHLISSGLHYRFNLAWLKIPPLSGSQ